MRLAYIGLSLALAVFIIAQGVNRPVILYALVIPLIVFIYGVLAEETLPEVPRDDDENTGNGDED